MMPTKVAPIRCRRLVPRHCAVALAAASVLGQLEPAHACGATPCLKLDAVQPPDGSVGVPRNTELRALYFGMLEYYDEASGASHALDLSPMRLVPSEGAPIQLAGSVLERPEALQAWAVGQHVDALAANTTYQLQLPFGERDDLCSEQAPEWRTVSSFTTGGDEDHEAPSFAGLESIGKGERRTSSSTCGTSDVIPLYPQFQPASDDSPHTRYNIYADGQIVQRYVDLALTTQVANAAVFVNCGSSALSTYASVASGARLELRAVDLAGNESPSNTPTASEASCEAASAQSPQPEAGPVLGPPGEPAAAVSDAADDDSTGSDGNDIPAETAPSGRASLGCAIAHAPLATPLLLLAVLPALLGRRVLSARARRLARRRAPEPKHVTTSTVSATR